MSKWLLFVDGSKITEDRGLNLVAGTNVTLTPADTQAGLPSVEIAASGGGTSVSYTFGGNVA